MRGSYSPVGKRIFRKSRPPKGDPPVTVGEIPPSFVLSVQRFVKERDDGRKDPTVRCSYRI